MYDMSSTLTIRADDALRKALAKRAASKGKTVSEVVREILHEGLTERPLGAKVGHLKGRIELSEKSLDRWRKQLRKRNWRS